MSFSSGAKNQHKSISAAFKKGRPRICHNGPILCANDSQPCVGTTDDYCCNNYKESFQDVIFIFFLKNFDSQVLYCSTTYGGQVLT